MPPLSPGFPAALLSPASGCGPQCQRAASAAVWISTAPGWCRYCPGKAKRARCINAVAEGRLPLADRHAAAAAAVFREAGLPLFPLPHALPPGPTAWTTGWSGRHAPDRRHPRDGDHRGARVRRGARYGHPGPRRPGRSSPRSSARCGRLAAEQRSAHAERMAQSPVPYQGWIVRQRDSGEGHRLRPDRQRGDMVGVYDVYTHPDHRGHAAWRGSCAAPLHGRRARRRRPGVAFTCRWTRPTRRRGPSTTGQSFADAYGYHYRTPDADAH